MKKLFISICTEYEVGWGQKPDGLLLSEDLKTLEEAIEPYNNRTKGSHEMYWNYSKPEEIYCSDEDFKKAFGNAEKILKHLKSIKTLNIDLFKKLD